MQQENMSLSGYMWKKCDKIREIMRRYVKNVQFDFALKKDADV